MYVNVMNASFRQRLTIAIVILEKKKLRPKYIVNEIWFQFKNSRTPFLTYLSKIYVVNSMLFTLEKFEEG